MRQAADPTACGLLEREAGYVLLRTRNAAVDLVIRQSEFRRRGGNFISPCPK